MARPFRSGARTAVEGICFRCDDCCSHFLDQIEPCDKGALVERTRLRTVRDAGPASSARALDRDELAIGREKCFGCGLCADASPEDCIKKIHR